MACNRTVLQISQAAVAYVSFTSSPTPSANQPFTNAALSAYGSIANNAIVQVNGVIITPNLNYTITGTTLLITQWLPSNSLVAVEPNASILSQSSGVLSTVSVNSANGFNGTAVTTGANAAITLTTTVNGLVKGNATALSAAVANVDYQLPVTFSTNQTTGAATFTNNALNIPVYQGQISLTTTGVSGAATFLNNVLNIPNYSGGFGSLNTVSLVSLNGFAGSSITTGSNAAITLSTTVTGIAKGNGSSLLPAVAGTDYQIPISLTTTGQSGPATFNSATGALNIPQYTGGSSGTSWTQASSIAVGDLFLGLLQKYQSYARLYLCI